MINKKGYPDVPIELLSYNRTTRFNFGGQRNGFRLNLAIERPKNYKFEFTYSPEKYKSKKIDEIANDKNVFYLSASTDGTVTYSAMKTFDISKLNKFLPQQFQLLNTATVFSSNKSLLAIPVHGFRINDMIGFNFYSSKYTFGTEFIYNQFKAEFARSFSLSASTFLLSYKFNAFGTKNIVLARNNDLSFQSSYANDKFNMTAVVNRNLFDKSYYLAGNIGMNLKFATIMLYGLIPNPTVGFVIRLRKEFDDNNFLSARFSRFLPIDQYPNLQASTIDFYHPE